MSKKIKRGCKRSKNQRRRDAAALQMLHKPTAATLDHFLGVAENLYSLGSEQDAAYRLYNLSGSKSDLRHLRLVF